jgi:hypothetical protein
MKNIFYKIITVVGYTIVIIILSQVFHRMSKYLSVILFDSSQWRLYSSYIVFYFFHAFGLCYFIYGNLHKNIRYIIGNGYPDFIITIDKKIFWLKVKITIRGELIRIISPSPTFNSGFDFKTKEIYVNYMYMVLKLKKFLFFIKEKDFVKILIIAKEYELLKKYFPKELRKEKIKSIL